MYLAGLADFSSLDVLTADYDAALTGIGDLGKKKKFQLFKRKKKTSEEAPAPPPTPEPPPAPAIDYAALLRQAEAEARARAEAETRARARAEIARRAQEEQIRREEARQAEALRQRDEERERLRLQHLREATKRTAESFVPMVYEEGKPPRPLIPTASYPAPQAARPRAYTPPRLPSSRRPQPEDAAERPRVQQPTWMLPVLAGAGVLMLARLLRTR